MEQDNPIWNHHLKNLEDGLEVHNEDGSVSTVRTIIVGDGEYEYLIPTIWDGKVLTDAEAFERAMSSGVDWPRAPAGAEGVEALENLDKIIHEGMEPSGYAEGGLVMPDDKKVVDPKVDAAQQTEDVLFKSVRSKPAELPASPVSQGKATYSAAPSKDLEATRSEKTQKMMDFGEQNYSFGEPEDEAYSFAEGGYVEGGPSQDPVSGNPVPVGSAAHEVRDDIPAKVSEGEMVIPADVVRYFGVKYFEDLRREAQGGYQSMSSEGRIGGNVPMVDDDPDPDDPYELAAKILSEPDDHTEPHGAFLGSLFGGTKINYQQPDPITPEQQLAEFQRANAPAEAFWGMNDWGTIGYSQFGSPAGWGGIVYLLYTDGKTTIRIPFSNGVPLSPIPRGFRPVDTPAGDSGGAESTNVSGGALGADHHANGSSWTSSRSRGDGAQRAPDENLYAMTEEELEAYVEGDGGFLSGTKIGDLAKISRLRAARKVIADRAAAGEEFSDGFQDKLEALENEIEDGFGFVGKGMLDDLVASGHARYLAQQVYNPNSNKFDPEATDASGRSVASGPRQRVTTTTPATGEEPLLPQHAAGMSGATKEPAAYTPDGKPIYKDGSPQDVVWTGRGGKGTEPVWQTGSYEMDQEVVRKIGEAAQAAFGDDLSHIIVRSAADGHSRNHGRGVGVSSVADIQIVKKDGTTVKADSEEMDRFADQASARGLSQIAYGREYMSNTAVHVGKETPPDGSGIYGDAFTTRGNWASRSAARKDELQKALDAYHQYGETTDNPYYKPSTERVAVEFVAPDGQSVVGSIAASAEYSGLGRAEVKNPDPASFEKYGEEVYGANGNAGPLSATEVDRINLAKTLAGEAGGSEREMLAVGAVIANRVATSGLSITEVVHQDNQFSMWNGTGVNNTSSSSKDGNTAAYRDPPPEALYVADRIIAGDYVDETKGAVNYYNPEDDSLTPGHSDGWGATPNWGATKDPEGWEQTAQIGGHVFGFARGAEKPPHAEGGTAPADSATATPNKLTNTAAERVASHLRMWGGFAGDEDGTLPDGATIIQKGSSPSPQHDIRYGDPSYAPDSSQGYQSAFVDKLPANEDPNNFIQFKSPDDGATIFFRKNPNFTPDGLLLNVSALSYVQKADEEGGAILSPNELAVAARQLQAVGMPATPQGVINDPTIISKTMIQNAPEGTGWFGTKLMASPIGRLNFSRPENDATGIETGLGVDKGLPEGAMAYETGFKRTSDTEDPYGSNMYGADSAMSRANGLMSRPSTRTSGMDGAGTTSGVASDMESGYTEPSYGWGTARTDGATTTYSNVDVTGGSYNPVSTTDTTTTNDYGGYSDTSGKDYYSGGSEDEDEDDPYESGSGAGYQMSKGGLVSRRKKKTDAKRPKRK